MKLFDKLSREELFSSKIKIEHIHINENNREYFWNIFSLYNSKRHYDNYTRQSYENLIKENRFNYGAVVVYRNDEIIAYTGLCDYNNWIIFTRMAYIKYTMYPFLSGYLVPYVVECAKNDQKYGVIMTLNKDKSYFLDIVKNNFSHHNNSKRHSEFLDHEIYEKAKKNNWVVLDHTVNYRNTEQFVAYIPFNNELPPFERWENK